MVPCTIWCLIVCQSFPSVVRPTKCSTPSKPVTATPLNVPGLPACPFTSPKPSHVPFACLIVCQRPPPPFVTPETCNSSLTLATAIFIKKPRSPACDFTSPKPSHVPFACLIVCQRSEVVVSIQR